MDRRSSLDGNDDEQSMRAMVNVFDDEFEVEDFDIVADGLHRNSDHDRERGYGGSAEERREEPVRSVAAHYAPASAVEVGESARRGVSMRSSMRKSRGVVAPVENPFASPHDEQEPAQRIPTLSFEPDAAHRSVSSASSHNFARSASPRYGAGPSHPYGMYPQGTMARSPSAATSSTVRPAQRQSSLRNGPLHPYTLYQQGVSEDVDAEDGAPQDAVPVGFPGHGQGYRRQRGPDGEEQDIIGEDGHTEPLPPYTRYPEDMPMKMPLLVPAAPDALHSRAPVAGTDPAMPLMHTSLQPQPGPAPASMSDQSNLLRQPSHGAPFTSPQQSLGKKSWSEKSWKEKRNTRFCGIPLWGILLSVSVLVITVVLIGAVIGGIDESRGNHNHSSDSGTSMSLYDASTVSATPTVSPATGTFALSLSTPQETQAQCLTQSGQQAAWSCDLGGEPGIALGVTALPNSNRTGAYIFYGSNDRQICYGAQTWAMNTGLTPFLAVVDNNSPASGPAYYFQQFYNKIVVVPENALNQNTRRIRRQYFNLGEGRLRQKQVAQAGEKPWFCVWNNTFLEGFVYVQQSVAPTFLNSNASTSAAPTTNTPPPSTATPASSPSPTPTAMVTTQPGPVIPMLTTTYTNPYTTAVFTGPASQYPAWSAGMDHANGHKRQLGDSDGDVYDSLAIYPYVVKLEERRLSGNTVPPYCQQMQILDNGGFNPVPGPPVMVNLVEQDPKFSAYQSAGIGMVPGDCHCQWMSGQS